MGATNNTYQYPDGPASEIAVAASGTMNAEIKNRETLMTISQMSAAGTLNLSVSDQVPAGANITIKVSADGTNRVLTLGTNMLGNAYTVTASKTATLTFKYMGGKFVNTGAILNN